MVEGRLEDELHHARARMRAELLHHVVWLVTLAAAGLAVRETVAGGPVLTAFLALLVGVSALVAARRGKLPPRALGFAFFCALVALIAGAALDFGGAAGSALSFAFLPGFLAGLVLGPAWGWAVSAAMLGAFAWLFATTPLPSEHDLLRFIDEIAMAVFATGLAHALTRSFDAYEAAAYRRRAVLLALRDDREALTLAVYDELEPLSANLFKAFDHDDFAAVDRGNLRPLLDGLIASLGRAKALARSDDAELAPLGDPDRAIRAASMRVWLRLAAVLMLFFVARNVLVGAIFAPSFVTLVACVVFDAWLARPAAGERLEVTALAIGVVATGPMIAHIHGYGVSPSAPPLVVTPGTVLFTALLSHGPAAWAVLLLNVGVVVWTAIGKTHPTLGESRLLGDLALSFGVVVVALRSVFALRLRYTRLLLEQGKAIGLALRQQRRLAGTLFHDVSNHLQSLLFCADFADPHEDFTHGRALSRRVARLIALSKGLLLSSPPGAPAGLVPISVSDVVAALEQAFARRLSDKRMRLTTDIAPALSALAEPDLLVESVLGNLLGNAVKFSPKGSSIELKAEENDGFVRLAISDAGPGLPNDVIDGLGADKALTSRQGTDGEVGQGYGLQLAREHLERIGGRLELKRRAGGGTDAIVWLRSA